MISLESGSLLKSGYSRCVSDGVLLLVQTVRGARGAAGSVREAEGAEDQGGAGGESGTAGARHQGDEDPG